MAAGLLWILDASINITMEPFRAFVADKLNADQRTTGFVMQSFFIGLGATFAGWLPLAFRRFGVSGNTDSGIPLTLKYAFQLGAAAFLLAVIWTVFTTKEYPPEDMQAFERMRREKKGVAAGLTEIITALRAGEGLRLGEEPAGHSIFANEVDEFALNADPVGAENARLIGRIGGF